MAAQRGGLFGVGKRKPVCVCCGPLMRSTRGYFLLDFFRSWPVCLRRVTYPPFRLQDDRLRAGIYAVLRSMSSRSVLGNRTPQSLSGKLISLCELREHYQVRETPNPTFDFKYSRLGPPPLNSFISSHLDQLICLVTLRHAGQPTL
jgi:hypothetical protein